MHRHFYTSLAQLGLCLVLTHTDEISLIQQIHNQTNKPLGFNNLSILHQTSTLTSTRPSTHHQIFLKPATVGLYRKWICDYKKISPHKRDSSQELYLTLISKIIRSFEITIQKQVTLTKRVEAKNIHFLHKDLARCVADLECFNLCLHSLLKMSLKAPKKIVVVGSIL